MSSMPCKALEPYAGLGQRQVYDAICHMARAGRLMAAAAGATIAYGLPSCDLPLGYVKHVPGGAVQGCPCFR